MKVIDPRSLIRFCHRVECDQLFTTSHLALDRGYVSVTQESPIKNASDVARHVGFVSELARFEPRPAFAAFLSKICWLYFIPAAAGLDVLWKPPCADRHAGWCGGWRRKIPGYPIGHHTPHYSKFSASAKSCGRPVARLFFFKFSISIKSI